MTYSAPAHPAGAVSVTVTDPGGSSDPVGYTYYPDDVTAPVIIGTATPAANPLGWNNSNVDVKFTCTDNTKVAGCAGDTTLSNEGAGQTVHGDAVDTAGNTSSADVGPINIDKTKPTLTGAASADANGAGWYNGDVTVNWTGVDALSGIDPATQPASSTVIGEGANLIAGPVTIADKAGNVSDPASVTGINIDRTGPVIAGGPTTAPNNAGWYQQSVLIDYTCTDSLSGVASCPTSTQLTGNGANQSVTSGLASDKAGNSATKTVTGLNVDAAAPSTTANNQCVTANGFCTGSTATVVLTATDQPGLSGVKEIHYTIDGGAEQTAAGATKAITVPLDGAGAGTVKYWAVDNAGNAEAPNAVSLKWDNIAPTVTHTVTPPPNADDWNKADVTVHFDAKDDDAGSGIEPGTVTPDVVVTAETSGQLITGSARDTVGNTGTDSVTVKLDKTAPVITGAVTAGVKGQNGWYTGPVTVHFTCSDALSGIASCPDDEVLTSNGANDAVGTATDKAGNTATATVSGITIDQEKPTITAVNVAGGLYILGTTPGATCAANDSFAGLASCTVTVAGGKANGVGTFTYTATATDKAGNTSTATGSYRVIYRFDGYLQPINDTGHQTGATTSIFKSGSTVPTKFQLKNGAGAIVQATTAPLWLTPVKGTPTTAAVDESLYADSPDSGSTYQLNGDTYQYNWKTNGAGFYWRIGVTLDDGQSYYVNIGLR